MQGEPIELVHLSPSKNLSERERWMHGFLGGLQSKSFLVTIIGQFVPLHSVAELHD